MMSHAVMRRILIFGGVRRQVGSNLAAAVMRLFDAGLLRKCWLGFDVAILGRFACSEYSVTLEPVRTGR